MADRTVAKTYRELLVWQKAMDLAEEIYKLTRSLPKEELYGLTSQLRRAAVSIPSNIAEGHARKHSKEFAHHLSFAKGSIAECETQLILAIRLGYLDRDSVKHSWALSQEVGKMISPMIRTLIKKGSHN